MKLKTYANKRKKLIKELRTMKNHRKMTNKDILRIRRTLTSLDNALINGDIHD